MGIRLDDWLPGFGHAILRRVDSAMTQVLVACHRNCNCNSSKWVLCFLGISVCHPSLGVLFGISLSSSGNSFLIVSFKQSFFKNPLLISLFSFKVLQQTATNLSQFVSFSIYAINSGRKNNSWYLAWSVAESALPLAINSTHFLSA